jgi:hypothetical protein
MQITAKVHFSDGDSFVTGINLSYQDAVEYYLGKWFNLGCVEDRMVKCVKVEGLT